MPAKARRYWAAMMLGRMLAAKLLKRVPGGHLVAASGAAAALATGLLLAAETSVSAAAAVTLVGFAYAAIYPTTLGMAGDRFPPFAGTVFGVLFSIGLIGGITFPWAAGHLAQAWGLRAGLALPLVGARWSHAAGAGHPPPLSSSLAPLTRSPEMIRSHCGQAETLSDQHREFGYGD